MYDFIAVIVTQVSGNKLEISLNNWTIRWHFEYL